MTAVADTIRMLSHLGGPECTEENIAWAADIPTGKKLLKWLASQMHAGDGDFSHSETSVASQSKEDVQSVALQTVISSISLYEDESSILSTLADHALLEATGNSSSSAYDLPSTLRCRAAAWEHEAELLEARATRLKRRREDARSTTKQMEEAINANRREVAAADEIAQEQQRQLAGLSVQVDHATRKCTENAGNLLENASQHGKSQISTLRSQLAHLERGRLAVTETVGRLHRMLDDAYAALPEGTGLQARATTLDACFRKVKADTANTSSLIAASYEDELERMVSRIEQLSPSDTEGLEGLMCFESQQENNKTAKSTLTLPLVPEVKAELEHAGLIDRISLLAQQETSVDRTSSDLRDRLLPRLQMCFDVLHTRNTLAVEAEVVVSALIEELEEINDVVEDVRRVGSNDSDQNRIPEDRFLEAVVVELLKKLLRSRSDRPTVLLNRSDLEIELASLADRSASVRKSEADWAAKLASHLNELSRSRAALLDIAYENSPMNTSAPFSPRSEEVIARDDARSRGELLRTEASRLQKESELSGRDQRKLIAFVEKWSSR
ncbi:hypothetical protein ONZ51_g7597 [Trametes cubensis]|uniref:Uncharacterized protein n=1 Tax=Trametes cubensis TaxID=1111947 RepID=A0AAD7XA16_9APHY|nr:hypothetical protein ONZ51_g7597 [Trametes cubensis]